MTHLRAGVPAFMFEQAREQCGADVEVVLLAPELDLRSVQFVVAEYGDPSWGSLQSALPELDGLQVVHSMSAGTDWIERLVPAGAVLTNSRGARDSPVAEWILGALLGTTSRLLEWAQHRQWEGGVYVDDLASWTIVVVGMGSIGHTLKRMLEPIGSRVIGVASRARDDLHGIDELPQLLPQADAVVILAPLTAHTRKLIGADELKLLRDGALVINAARGAVLDTDALVAETTLPRLRAVLDVTAPEPLPDGHPLWSCPGVLSITPHIAGSSRLADTTATDLACEQIARWQAGDPLLNVITRPVVRG